MACKVFRRFVAGLIVLTVSIAAMPTRAQDVVANPTTYDFFSVYIGRSATMMGTITNAAVGTTTISGYEWLYNPLDAFEVTSPISVPHPLAAGASVDYQVTFTPPDISFWNATLRFYTDSATTPIVDVQFWGLGDFPPDIPTIAVSPLTLGFGAVLMGTDGTRAVTVTNIGGGDLMVDLTIVGSTDFEIGSDTSLALPAKSSEPVTVVYSPSGIGSDTADLVIAHNDTSLVGDIVVPLSGTGLYNPELPDIAVSPLALDFGEVFRGSDGSQTITITNSGGGELVVDVTIAGSTDFDFPTGAPTSYTLTGGQAQDVVLLYSPSDTGDDFADLVIAHNDPDSPGDILVPLSGTGLSPVFPKIVVSALTLDFDAVPVGAEISQTTTITNTGGGLLAVSLTLTGSTDFGFGPGTPTSFELPSGAAQVVTLRYSPSDIGDDVGGVVIEHNDEDLVDDIQVELMGNGFSAVIDCDVDGDLDIDKTDIINISLARNTPASGPDDPRDADEDGRVTVLDARTCVLRCTLPKCEVL